MTIQDLLHKTLLEGYATSEIQIGTIFFCLLFTTAIAVYIFAIYKAVNRNTFYNRNFNLSLIGIAIVTAAIILTIQSNIVVSLGMVGALSIVRFRTAIKDPLDLFFLFWAISAGIICGAGFAMIAIVASIILTVIMVCISMAPSASGKLVLVVNAASIESEEKVMQIVKQFCRTSKTRARNASKTGLNLAIEVSVQDQAALIHQLLQQDEVLTASLVEHDGSITI